MKQIQILLIFLLITTSTSIHSQTIFYVDDDTPCTVACTGLTWATAFDNLQDALTAATPNSEIWVATGTYYPDEGIGQTNNDRNAHFAMKNNVIIYGGFEGNENALTFDLADRDFVTNETILSGDIDQNDETNDISSNTFNIIRNGNTIDQTAQLNGFTIERGNTQGASFPLTDGGGMHNDGQNGGICNPTVVNCIFRMNRASRGAAISNRAANGTSNPTFTNCLFYDNEVRYNSTISYGGALRFVGNINATITNCTFNNNFALGRGGAISMAANFGNPTIHITNSIFWGNTAQNFAPEIAVGSNCTLNIAHTIIEGGLGAIHLFSSNSIVNDNSNNLNQDPLFVDEANKNFQLQATSPALDAGTNSADLDGNLGGTQTIADIPIDVAGNERIVDFDKDNTATVDMGAYETAVPPDVVPTLSEWGLINLALLLMICGTLVLIQEGRAIEVH